MERSGGRPAGAAGGPRRYRLHISAAARGRVERALARHQDKYPTAATLSGAVQLSWTAEIVEV